MYVFRNRIFVRDTLTVLAVLLVFGGCREGPAGNKQETTAVLSPNDGFAGTQSCRPCHERFYQLWVSSRHALAMRPFTPDFAARAVTQTSGEIMADGNRYTVEIEDGIGWICETQRSGKKNKYPIEHVMGGKYVYYFLTTMQKGRLQVLPLAYDVDEKSWFDVTAGMIRHFESGARDEAVDWRDKVLTFNAACHDCHVSRLSKNYDPDGDTYETRWEEPGVNCETCHGPCREHIRVCAKTPEGEDPADLELIRATRFTAQETNDLCAPCHAKSRPLTVSFEPGERFFDQYSLVTLEHDDFFPDGRDLGENYTYTHWLMSPCVKGGELDCLHCHTSSGRYRFRDENRNGACLPCHERHVQSAGAHTHHREGSEGNLCISCHMPKTTFARMERSDHSMRPPAPAVSIVYGSPNACTICHTDRDARWADMWVKKWRDRDYQAPVLYLAGLVDAGRKKDWSKAPEIFHYITNPDHNDVFAAALIRLLKSCESDDKWHPLLSALESGSPLVRAAAAAALEGCHTPRCMEALLRAAGDEYRVVRFAAATALAGFPESLLTGKYLDKARPAFAEYESSLKARTDQWLSFYNLGNFYFNRGRLQMSARSYETAMKLEPTAVMPLINSAIVYNRLGDTYKAETYLRKAITIEPENIVANYNLGLLLAEKGDVENAEKALRAAFESDSTAVDAAYNLGILLASRDIEQAIHYCGRAMELRRDESRYVYTYAYYLNRADRRSESIDVLENHVKSGKADVDIHLFLGALYDENGEREKAVELYNETLQNPLLNETDRRRISAGLNALSGARQ